MYGEIKTTTEKNYDTFANIIRNNNLSGIEVLDMITNVKGLQILDEEMMQELVDRGLIDDFEEEKTCDNCVHCDQMYDHDVEACNCCENCSNWDEECHD